MSVGNMKIVSALVAAGTPLTNATAETVLASHVLPARYFTDGKTIRIVGSVRTTAQNSTDTLTIRVRIGPTTLTGTAVFTSAAVDQVVDDTCVFEFEALARDADSSGTLIVRGAASPPDANGTAMVSIAPPPLTSLDFTGTLRIEVTGTWSVASGSNSCQAESLSVYEVV